MNQDPQAKELIASLDVQNRARRSKLLAVAKRRASRSIVILLYLIPFLGWLIFSWIKGTINNAQWWLFVLSLYVVQLYAWQIDNRLDALMELLKDSDAIEP